MENINKTPATPDMVWETLQEVAAIHKEVAAIYKEVAASYKEIAADQKETGRQIKELKESITGISNSNGLFAEEYFLNSFENGKNTFFGEKFDEIIPNLKTGLNEKIKDEYDIVLINGTYIGIIEVKYKGRLDDIPKVISKAQTFRVNYPKYQNHRIYLALATMIFNQRLEDECKKKGIAIVKQVGDTVVMNEENLKVY